MKVFFICLLLLNSALADSLIVEFSSPLTHTQVKSLKESYDLKSIKPFTTYENDYFKRLYSVEVDTNNIENLSKDGLVKLIERDFEAQYYEIRINPRSEMKTDDLLFPQQWGLYNQEQTVETLTIGGKKKITPGVRGVDINWKDIIEEVENSLVKTPVVAVVDMGIDLDHKDLKGQIYRNEKECDENGNVPSKVEDRDGNKLPSDCHGWNFAAIDQRSFHFPFDDKNHGTHVSGIIAATKNNELGISGVSDKIKILPVRVTGSVDETMDKDKLLIRSAAQRIANGILYAVKMNVDVINLSLGWPKSMDTKFMRNVINEALSKGIVVVAAAGNDNSDQGIFPCNYRGVICVGSVDINGRVSGFSNYGGQVDILAPGDQIVSTIPEKFISIKLNIEGYDILSGTSQAAPFVSAIAALMRGQNPRMSLDELKFRLFQSAQMKKSPSKSLHGLINFKGAVEAKPGSLVMPVFKEINEALLDPQTGRAAFPIYLKNYGNQEGKVKYKVESLNSYLLIQNSESREVAINPGQATQVPIYVSAKTLDRDRIFKFKVILEEQGRLREYYHQVTLGLDITKLPFQTFGFKFKDAPKPILLRNNESGQISDNLNTVDELNPSGEMPTYFMIQNKENKTSLSLFNFDGRGFEESSTTLKLNNVKKLLGIIKHDLNYDGKKDILALTIHCEGESCETEKIKEADLYLRFTYLDRNLNPLFKKHSSLFLRDTENVQFDFKSTRFYRSNNRALPYFIATGELPKANLNGEHLVKNSEPIDLDSETIGDNLLNIFRQRRPERKRRLYRYRMRSGSSDLELRSFMDKDFYSAVKQKMSEVLNQRIDRENAKVNLTHLLQQSDEDLKQNKVKAMLSYGLGIYQYNIIMEIQDGKFSLGPRLDLTQPILGNTQFKTINLSERNAPYNDAFVFFTTSNLLTVTSYDSRVSETIVPYRLENPNDAILGFVGLFNSGAEQELYFEQVDSIALRKYQHNQLVGSYDSKINKFSFLPGRLMTETFYPVVLDNKGESKFESGIYIDNTAISSNQLYIKTVVNGELIAPLRTSLMLPGACRSKNPSKLGSGSFAFTILCLEPNGSFRLKFLPFLK